MKFNNIYFVNHFHNGDLHLSRGLVRFMKEKFPQFKYHYAHQCDAKVIKDLGMQHVNKRNIPMFKDRFGSNLVGDKLYLNTWYAAHGNKYFNAWGIVFDVLYYLFDDYLKAHFNTNFDELKVDPKDLMPSIDFSKYETSNVDNFFKDKKYKKYIMFCNCNSLSGQAANFSFAPAIKYFSKIYPNYGIIYTNTDKTIANASNVYSVSKIIGNIGNDLNECSYISEKCDFIVGKSSGPYTFAMTKKNMLESNKTMISFSSIGGANNKYWLGPKLASKINYSSTILNFNIKNSNDSLLKLKEYIK